MSRPRDFVLVACGALTALVAVSFAVLRVPGGSDSPVDRPAGQATGRAFASSEPGLSYGALSGIAAGTDPSSAVDAALALADAAEREATLHEALPEFLSEHPDRASEWLREKLPTLAPDTGIAVLRELASFDPQLALELADNANGAARRAASREVQIVWAATDPVASSQAFLMDPAANDMNPAADDGGAAEISRLWAYQDPASAFAFAAALPSTGARLEALATVVESWAASDPESTARAVANLPQTPSRMPLVDRVAVQWASSSPEAALAWAQALPLEEERLAATTTVLGVTASSAARVSGKP